MNETMHTGATWRSRWVGQARIVLGILSLLVVLFANATPISARAATSDSAGFLRESIWFSRDPFYAGETITIYTNIYNSSSERLSGLIEFRDGTTVLGTKAISVAPGGASEIISLPWVVTAGEHRIEARFREAYFSTEGGQVATATPKFSSSGALVRTAEDDNDGDRIADRLDPDDDNDGLMDVVEVRQKTDPKRADTDGDGILDAVDPEPLIKRVQTEATSTRVAAKVGEEVKDLATDAANMLPTDLKEKSIPVIGAFEAIREAEEGRNGTRVALARAKLLEGGTASSTASSSPLASDSDWQVLRDGVTSMSAVKSPFAYLWFLVLLVYQWIVMHPIVLYAIVIIFVIQLLRAIVGLFT